MLGAELSHHRGDAPGGTKPDETTNHRSGTNEKRVLTDELIWLALSNIIADWVRPAGHWKASLNQFAIMYTPLCRPRPASFGAARTK